AEIEQPLQDELVYHRWPADGGIGSQGVDLGVVEERRQPADMILPGAGGIRVHGQQAIDVGAVHQRQKLFAKQHVLGPLGAVHQGDVVEFVAVVQGVPQ